MSSPTLQTFPPTKLKKQIDPQEWNQLLAAWNTLVRAYLDLADDEFGRLTLRTEANVEAFLASYLDRANSSEEYFADTELERSLKQSCFILTTRLSNLATQRLPRIQNVEFIQNLCILYLQSPQLRAAAERLWEAARKFSNPKITEWKDGLTKKMTTQSGTSSASWNLELTRLVACVRTIPGCGSLLMEGSDFLDAMESSWAQSSSGISRKLVIVSFYCLVSLIESRPQNKSLLVDHLYTLKANHEQRMRNGNTSSLLAQILGTTPILDKLERVFAPVQGRGTALLQDLQAITKGSGLQRRRSRFKTSDKGKGKATESVSEDLQVHKMSLVTQVQDLFPSMDVSRILPLLDIYHDNPEQVVAYLLDNPPSPPQTVLSEQTQRPLPTISEASAKLPPHAPYTAQLPTRSIIYDDEDLATLSLDSSRLFTGHKPDTTSFQSTSTSAKAAILSALAAFDSDSDERDDTYDVDDVGGTVDITISGTGEDDTNVNEEVLYTAWKSAPALFARDTATRRSKPRAELREKTGLTDESIEGWAIMLARDPRRQNRLAARYTVFYGQQTELQSSSWKTNDEDADSDGEVQRHHTDRGRGGRPRGRGSGRGRGVGEQQRVGGEASTGGGHTNTANDRRRKDANKGSRANHNRRDQRARKVARAGFPG